MASDEWFAKVMGNEMGPMGPADLKRMAAARQITPRDRVKKGKDGAWTEAGSVPGLFDGAHTVRSVSSVGETLPEKGKAARPIEAVVVEPATTAIPQWVSKLNGTAAAMLNAARQQPYTLLFAGVVLTGLLLLAAGFLVGVSGRVSKRKYDDALAQVSAVETAAKAAKDETSQVAAQLGHLRIEVEQKDRELSRLTKSVADLRNEKGVPEWANPEKWAEVESAQIKLKSVHDKLKDERDRLAAELGAERRAKIDARRADKSESTNKPKRKAPEPREQAVITVDAERLFDDYEANEVAADEKYKGKLLEITGTVDNIGKDILGTMYLALNAGKSEFALFSVQCMFPDSLKGRLANIAKGSEVILRGRCRGKLGNVLVDKCEFAD